MLHLTGSLVFEKTRQTRSSTTCVYSCAATSKCTIGLATSFFLLKYSPIIAVISPSAFAWSDLCLHTCRHDVLFGILHSPDQKQYSNTKYEFRPSLATPILFLVDVRRDVPNFYNTFLVRIVASVATPDQASAASWWSAALAHTIPRCMPMPQPSAQVSSPHHG